MNGSFLQLNAQTALLGIALAVRALSAGPVPAAWAIELVKPDSASEQRLVSVCDVAPRVDRGYLGPLTDSMLATGGGDGFPMTERAGAGSAC